MSFFLHSLTNEEIKRFSRQLVLHGFGPLAQEKLRDCRVLIVGAGGLGCPVAVYLAAAGVGTIGIVDHDTVSIDNLHRQVMHDENRIGMNKSQSLKESIKRLNSSICVISFETLLSTNNALNIVQDFNIVVDCSDNVATRYLINDTCVLLKKPLVSGSALGWEGQLTVYNNGPKCPCYRCIFPVPPNPSTVINCSEGGVLGPIVGVIGSLQALEVIRIAIKGDSPFSGYLWLFDGLDGRTKTICLREKMPTCAVCGVNPTITELQDYVAFCKSGFSDKVQCVSLLTSEQRVTVQDYCKKRQENSAVFLIDVRPPTEFQICHLPEAINISLDDIKRLSINSILQIVTDNMNKLPHTAYVVCHRGNDSQLAVSILTEKAAASNYQILFRDLIGGLETWALEIDDQFPKY